MKLAGPSLMIALIITGLIVSAQAEMQEGEEAKAEEEGVGLERIVVTNRRTSVGLGEVTENITLLDEEEIKNLPVRNLSEALSYIPGVYIESRKGFGRASAINIQGSTSNQVRVMIDGIPLNSLATGQIDLARFPIENVSRIEVLKGAASSIWGSGLGGVINVITKDTGKTSTPKASLTASFAEFRTKKESFDLSGKVACLGYYLFSSYMESGGKGPRDDVLEKKAFGKLSYDLKEKGRIIASFGYGDADVNSGEYPPDAMYKWQSQPYLNSYAKLSWEGGLDDTELKLDLKHFRHTIINKAYDSIADDTPSARAEARDRLSQLSLNTATRIRKEDLLVIGADFDCDTLKTTYLFKAKNIKTQAPYVNYTLKLRPWDFNFGLRYDRNSEFGEQLSPTFGFVYKFNNLHDTLIRATVSRAFNAPALLWKYYEQALSGLITNPDIGPERAWVYEAGMESKPFSKFWMKFSLYRSDVTDAIALAENAASQFYMENFEKFRRQGAELQFKLNIFEGLDFSASGAFNDVEDRATRETVRGGVGPRQSFDLSIEYKNKSGLRLSILSYYNRWNEPAYSYSNDRKMLTDLKISQEFKNLALFLNIYNLSNSKYWSDYYFPYPERYFEGGMSLKW
jgi:vitamin B12 transporter